MQSTATQLNSQFSFGRIAHLTMSLYVVVVLAPSPATAEFIDFESEPFGRIITTQFESQGVVFSSLGDPHLLIGDFSGGSTTGNILEDFSPEGGFVLIADFSPPVSRVSALTYANPAFNVNMRAFDKDSEIGTVTSAGGTVNQGTLALDGIGPISRVAWSIDSDVAGGGIDNLEFTPFRGSGFLMRSHTIVNHTGLIANDAELFIDGSIDMSDVVETDSVFGEGMVNDTPTGIEVLYESLVNDIGPRGHGTFGVLFRPGAVPDDEDEGPEWRGTLTIDGDELMRLPGIRHFLERLESIPDPGLFLDSFTNLSQGTLNVQRRVNVLPGGVELGDLNIDSAIYETAALLDAKPISLEAGQEISAEIEGLDGTASYSVVSIVDVFDPLIDSDTPLFTSFSARLVPEPGTLSLSFAAIIVVLSCARRIARRCA